MVDYLNVDRSQIIENLHTFICYCDSESTYNFDTSHISYINNELRNAIYGKIVDCIDAAIKYIIREGLCERLSREQFKIPFVALPVDIKIPHRYPYKDGYKCELYKKYIQVIRHFKTLYLLANDDDSFEWTFVSEDFTFEIGCRITTPTILKTIHNHYVNKRKVSEMLKYVCCDDMIEKIMEFIV